MGKYVQASKKNGTFEGFVIGSSKLDIAAKIKKFGVKPHGRVFKVIGNGKYEVQ